MLPYPPPLSIPDNNINMILCILAEFNLRARVGAIFALIVERINLISNLIGNTLNNYI